MSQQIQITQDYKLLINEIGTLLQQSRTQVAYAVNTILVDTYWQIGKYIVEYEQNGTKKQSMAATYSIVSLKT